MFDFVNRDKNGDTGTIKSFKKENITFRDISGFVTANCTKTNSGNVITINPTAIADCGAVDSTLTIVPNKPYIIEFDIMIPNTNYNPKVLIANTSWSNGVSYYIGGTKVANQWMHFKKTVYHPSLGRCFVLFGTTGHSVGQTYQLKNIKMYKRGW